MRYSVALVLDKLLSLSKSLRTYKLEETVIDSALRQYAEVLWDRGSDVIFLVERTDNPQDQQRRIVSLETDASTDDWNVESFQMVCGLRVRGDTQAFLICIYTPNQGYIDQLDAMIEYLPDGAVLDYEYPEANDEDDSDQNFED